MNFDWLKSEYWSGIEAIATIIVFALSGFAFWHEKHQQNKLLRTSELRNEMLVFFNCIKEFKFSIIYQHWTSVEYLNAYLIIFDKIEKNKNIGLIREFGLNMRTYELCDEYFRLLERKFTKYHHGSMERIDENNQSKIKELNCTETMEKIREIRNNYFNVN